MKLSKHDEIRAEQNGQCKKVKFFTRIKGLGTRRVVLIADTRVLNKRPDMVVTCKIFSTFPGAKTHLVYESSKDWSLRKFDDLWKLVTAVDKAVEHGVRTSATECADLVQDIYDHLESQLKYDRCLNYGRTNPGSVFHGGITS